MEPTGLPLRRALALGFVTFLLMLPETLPVPVLRGLVVDRFAVGDREASWFMAANMIGALLAAPLLGLLVDRSGRRRTLVWLCLLADAALMQALAHPHDYASFLLLRGLEGATHIAALTVLMSLCTDAAGARRGRVLGCLGAGLTLGVATGAAIGGVIGKRDPLLTLHVASAVLLVAALLAAWLLPADTPTTATRPRLGELLADLRRQPGLRVPLLLAFIDRFTVGFFTTGFPLLLASVHQVDRPRIGMLLGAFLYPFALLSWPFGRLAETWSRPLLVAIGSLVYGAGVMAIGVVEPAVMWWLMPVLGIGSAVMFVPTLLWLIESAPGVGRTTTMAAFHAAGSLGFLLGPICCGELIRLGGTGPDGGGYALAFAVAGATEVLGAALVLVVSRRRLGRR
ncbi:MAG: MFS transporter [Planctomycetes bacterium]|jgi:MFS family permease|nr:MFS transporter [Planctomycetota bacterium]